MTAALSLSAPRLPSLLSCSACRCEYLARVAYVTHNGKKEGISWAFDRALISVVPDDVAMAILPWECYGGAHHLRAIAHRQAKT